MASILATEFGSAPWLEVSLKIIVVTVYRRVTKIELGTFLAVELVPRVAMGKWHAFMQDQALVRAAAIINKHVAHSNSITQVRFVTSFTFFFRVGAKVITQ